MLSIGDCQNLAIECFNENKSFFQNLFGWGATHDVPKNYCFCYALLVNQISFQKKLNSIKVVEGEVLIISAFN